MRDKQHRLERIRTAKAELEAEAPVVEAARPDPGCKPDGSPRLRRGRKVKREWAPICTAHNLTKLARVAAA